MGKSNLRFGALVCVNVLAWCVLGFYGASFAQRPPTSRQPFNNSVAQRQTMIEELREIKTLLKEQNKLLREQLRKDKPDGETKR